ncbi:MAG: type II/IV secretion system protein [Candidatus Riflebacteria bacterium]|nr:type II/IV secretion system protein [Candidatus Riflebacteria bacterium]
MARRSEDSLGNPERLLTLEEAAAFLGTSKPTLYRFLDQGRIKGRKVGNQWRFLRADLQAYLDRGPGATVLPSVPREVLDAEAAFFVGELKKLRLEAPPMDEECQDETERRVSALIGAVLTLAVEGRASDIHLEAVHERGEVQSLLRFRIDGVLQEIRRVPAAVATAVASCLKKWMVMDPDLRRPQDGRMLTRIRDREVDFRASVLPTIFGESVVLRILDRQSIVLGLDRLGLSAKDQETLRGWTRRSHGLVIVTGPTGCGKTTLLYSLLQEIARPQVKTLTLEDPVELAMPWSTQTQIDPGQGVTFPAALRSIMRQDPDVIMVGEIRDQETMLGCIQAALTGHLVLTTLHAPGAVEALLRVRDMGIEPFLLGSALVGVVAERLVRTVCPECGQPAALTGEMRAAVAGLAERGGLPLPPKPHFQAGRGCRACFGSGFRGRTGVFEVLEGNPTLIDAFMKGTAEKELRALAVREGMVALAADALRKAVAGATSIAEILRVFPTE